MKTTVDYACKMAMKNAIKDDENDLLERRTLQIWKAATPPSAPPSPPSSIATVLHLERRTRNENHSSARPLLHRRCHPLPVVLRRSSSSAANRPPLPTVLAAIPATDVLASPSPASDKKPTGCGNKDLIEIDIFNEQWQQIGISCFL
nr:hypothetical protein Iba_chr01bCG4000 [Ipomoea batatas]